MDRYMPPISRDAAVELILSAFASVAPERVNTPARVTMAQAGLALRALGVRTYEIEAAARALGLEAS